MSCLIWERDIKDVDFEDTKHDSVSVGSPVFYTHLSHFWYAVHLLPGGDFFCLSWMFWWLSPCAQNESPFGRSTNIDFQAQTTNAISRRQLQVWKRIHPATFQILSEDVSKTSVVAFGRATSSMESWVGTLWTSQQQEKILRCWSVEVTYRPIAFAVSKEKALILGCRSRFGIITSTFRFDEVVVFRFVSFRMQIVIICLVGIF